jgi:hypothetical protein
MSRKELDRLLIDYAGENIDFADYISDMTLIKSDHSGKNEYRKIIKNAIRNVRRGDGFIGYKETPVAVRGAEIVLEKASNFLDEKNLEKALEIFQVVLEEMVPFLQEADDSDGVIGDVIRDAFAGLSYCAEESKNSDFRKKLFDYLLKESEHKNYVGWNDMIWHFLSIAGYMVESLEEKEKIFKQIDDIEKRCRVTGDLFNYDYEEALKIKMSVLERLVDDKEVEVFLNQNLDCTSFREQAIERAIKKKDYKLANKLALDGLAQDKAKGLYGLVIKWKKYLLQIAKKHKDILDIKKYLLELFFDTSELAYYEEYKKKFSYREWEQESQKIFDMIKQSKNGQLISILPEIYIREKQWQNLLNYVKNNNSFWSLDKFASELVMHYPDEVIHLYETVINEQLAPQIGREKYIFLCRYIRRFQKLTDKERTKQMVLTLLEKYKNRPAMCEELIKVL